jgi:hypothetical protein
MKISLKFVDSYPTLEPLLEHLLCTLTMEFSIFALA